MHQELVKYCLLLTTNLQVVILQALKLLLFRIIITSLGTSANTAEIHALTLTAAGEVQSCQSNEVSVFESGPK